MRVARNEPGRDVAEVRAPAAHVRRSLERVPFGRCEVRGDIAPLEHLADAGWSIVPERGSARRAERGDRAEPSHFWRGEKCTAAADTGSHEGEPAGVDEILRRSHGGDAYDVVRDPSEANPRDAADERMVERHFVEIGRGIDDEKAFTSANGFTMATQIECERGDAGGEKIGNEWRVAVARCGVLVGEDGEGKTGARRRRRGIPQRAPENQTSSRRDRDLERGESRQRRHARPSCFVRRSKSAASMPVPRRGPRTAMISARVPSIRRSRSSPIMRANLRSYSSWSSSPVAR